MWRPLGWRISRTEAVKAFAIVTISTRIFSFHQLLQAVLSQV